MSNISFPNVKLSGLATHDIKKVKVFEDFVHFMSLPDPEKAVFLDTPIDVKTNRRSIPTQGDFAVKYGVSPTTLVMWKKKEAFIHAVDTKRKQWGLEKVPNVLAALYNRCIKYGMAYDVETYLAYYTNWNRTQIIKHTQDKFDANDLRSIINQLPANKQKDIYAQFAELITEAELSGSLEEGTRDAVIVPTRDSGATGN